MPSPRHHSRILQWHGGHRTTGVVGCRELEQRKKGQLRRALSGESQEEMDRIAEEDQRRAQAGLVDLRSGEEI
jgi:hypothetical protein